MNTYPQITDFLGSEASRYFPEGFKHFRWTVASMKQQNDALSGNIQVQYNGPPRPRSESVHLGSMEYTAMAFMLAEYTLVYQLGLTRNQVSHSLARSCQLKLSQELIVSGRTLVPFQCKHNGKNQSLQSKHRDASMLTMQIGSAQLKIEINHPIPTYCHLIPTVEWPLNTTAMYNHGYRLRHHLLQQVACSIHALRCITQVSRQDQYAVERAGLSTAYQTILPTDVLSITGQLMQVLLYTLLGTDRQQCSNIWLRRFALRFGRPIRQASFPASVTFTHMEIKQIGRIHWRTITLESQMDNIHGTFHIAHQIKPS